jgi:hypothetical protein
MNKRLRDLFEYANGKLFWRVNRGRVHAGDEAGTIGQIGKMYVQVDKKKYLVHRVIWMLHNDDCPEFIDHIDGNPLNNRIDNLRPATKSQNAMNRKMHRNNASGFKGVYQIPSKKFAASICISGKNKYLGVFETPELAQNAYALAAQQYFKEYARV